MRKIVLLAIISALLGGGFVSTASAQLRVGTFDMKKILEGYHKAKAADEKVAEQRKSVNKELESRVEPFRKAVGELQKLDEDLKRPELSALSRGERERERAEKLARINAMQRENTEVRERLEKEFQEMATRLRDPILEDIKRVLAERARAAQYDLVFDLAAQGLHGFPVIAYSKESYDFTADVLLALNNAKPAAPILRSGEVVRPATVPKKPK
jgi:Skp family chaperone for outer membrane proteins